MDVMQQLNDALAGRYDILREVGAGGMATVSLVRDIRHDRNVAVTVLNRELGAVLGFSCAAATMGKARPSTRRYTSRPIINSA